MEVGQNGLKNQILIYTCDICEQDFNRIQNLRSHFSATHSKSPNKNSLNCNVRPNPFQSQHKSTFHIDTYIMANKKVINVMLVINHFLMLVF